MKPLLHRSSLPDATLLPTDTPGPESAFSDKDVSTHQRAMSTSLPMEEEDISSGATAWRSADKDDDDDSDDEASSPPFPSKWKGKGRAVEEDDYEEDEPMANGHASYPPVQEDEAEERRVAENLRKWEQAEREKRRQSREADNDNEPTSVVGMFGKRASLLWGRGVKSRPGGMGAVTGHRVLGSTDEADAADSTATPSSAQIPIPLSHLDNSPSPTPAAPGTPTQATVALSDGTATPTRARSPSPTALSKRVSNPFADPRPGHHQASSSSSSLSVHSEQAVMKSQPSTPMAPETVIKSLGEDGISLPMASPPASSTSHNGKGPAIIRARSLYAKVPPPKPLDIPPPVTPPPRLETPDPEDSLNDISREQTVDEHDDVPERESRWWTDWLCGCSEGRDRGGDRQAGRTNPFE